MTTLHSLGSLGSLKISLLHTAGDCFPQIIYVINDNANESSHLTLGLGMGCFFLQIKNDLFTAFIVLLAGVQYEGLRL